MIQILNLYDKSQEGMNVSIAVSQIEQFSYLNCAILTRDFLTHVLDELLATD